MAVFSAAASLLAGSEQADAAEDAAQLQLQGQREAIAEQRRQYEQTREDFAPYRETGVNALAQYAALYGIGRGTTSMEPEFLTERYQTGTERVPIYTQGQWLGHEAGGGMERQLLRYDDRPTYATREVANPAYDPDSGFLSRDEMQAARDRFMETPGYQFRFDEGLRALDRSASARGRLGSGGRDRELIRYGQGIAADEFQTYADRLAGIAGMGQGATTTTATLGQQSSNAISNALQTGAARAGGYIADAGTARASGYVGAANAVNRGFQNALMAAYLFPGGGGGGAPGFAHFGGPR